MSELRSCCPIAASLDLIGDRWSLVVLRDMLFGGVCRFSDFAVDEGVATNVLSERLDRLTREGLITVRKDPADGRRKLYAPTEAAIALIPLLVEFAIWGTTFTDATGAAKIAEQARHDRDAVVAALTERARSFGEDD